MFIIPLPPTPARKSAKAALALVVLSVSLAACTESEPPLSPKVEAERAQTTQNVLAFFEEGCVANIANLSAAKSTLDGLGWDDVSKDGDTYIYYNEAGDISANFASVIEETRQNGRVVARNRFVSCVVAAPSTPRPFVRSAVRDIHNRTNTGGSAFETYRDEEVLAAYVYDPIVHGRITELHAFSTFSPIGVYANPDEPELEGLPLLSPFTGFFLGSVEELP